MSRLICDLQSVPKGPAARCLAGALSLFPGIFLAFFLEYWARITREQAEAARPALPRGSLWQPGKPQAGRRDTSRRLLMFQAPRRHAGETFP